MSGLTAAFDIGFLFYGLLYYVSTFERDLFDFYVLLRVRSGWLCTYTHILWPQSGPLEYSYEISL